MMGHHLPESHPLHRLFRGLTEHAFLSELGIGDPRLVGYVADLLARFVPIENLYPLRDAEGRRLTEVTAMLSEAEAAGDEEHRRECHRHVGDYTLFWTGVFPEAVARLKAAGTASDRLLDYQRQGKRSYYLASTYRGDDAAVLRGSAPSSRSAPMVFPASARNGKPCPRPARGDPS